MLFSARLGCAVCPLALSLVAFGGLSVLAPAYRVALPTDTIANGNVVTFRYDGGIMTFDVADRWGHSDDVFGRLDAQVGNT